MKKLSQLLESINEVNSLLELDFIDKKAFQKYQAKHKMKPTTKINIAGKDTTVGDEMGDDSETPKAPKKTTGADIEKQASKSGKEKSDIEKDIMGDEPKSDEPVKLDDDAQETIDSMDWNYYHGATSERGLDRSFARTRVIKDMGDSVEEFNAQINRVYDEMTGQIPQEHLDKLKGALIDDSEMDDAVLSKVDNDEFAKKIQTIYDFHKKYSTQTTGYGTSGRSIPNEFETQATKSDEPKSDKEKSRERVKTAQDLDDMEKIKKDPMGTLNKMNRLINNVRSDLTDNKDVDKEFSILDDEFGTRAYQLKTDLRYAMNNNMTERYKDLHDGIKDLTSDFERFMDDNYSKLTGIAKPKNENFDLRQLSKITTRYNK